jgi:hypothetical protein
MPKTSQHRVEKPKAWIWEDFHLCRVGPGRSMWEWTLEARLLVLTFVLISMDLFRRSILRRSLVGTVWLA